MSFVGLLSICNITTNSFTDQCQIPSSLKGIFMLVKHRLLLNFIYPTISFLSSTLQGPPGSMGKRGPPGKDGMEVSRVKHLLLTQGEFYTEK